MNAKDTYKIQQKYYYNFSFFPMRGLKKHNYFVYKMYDGKGHKLNDLFENMLNSEVLDVNCIIAIRKKIIKTNIPLTQSVINDLQCVLYPLSKLTPSFDRSCMLYVLSTVHTLQRNIVNYEEMLHQLTDEMKKLLGNSRFTTQYRTSSEDIDHVINLIQKMSKDLEGGIGCFIDFNRKQPLAFTNLQAMEQAKRSVTDLVASLEKLLQVQQLLILQLRSWKRIRVLHEQQQVLN